jgi:hypothetical protein
VYLQQITLHSILYHFIHSLLYFNSLSSLYIYITIFSGSRNGIVNIVSRLQVKQLKYHGLNPGMGKFFSSLKHSGWCWGLQRLPFNGCWCLSPGVKQPQHEADHSPPSITKVKNAWSYTSTPPFVIVVCTETTPFNFYKYRICYLLIWLTPGVHISWPPHHWASFVWWHLIFVGPQYEAASCHPSGTPT